MISKKAAKQPEVVSVLGGLLVQEPDDQIETPEDWTVVTKRKPTTEEIAALAFAWKAVKHVKSNAIVLANQQQTVGIGAGQMNRVGSVKIAVEQARENNKLAGSVLASDAFSQWMTVLNMQRNKESKRLFNLVAVSKIKSRSTWQINTVWRWSLLVFVILNTKK